jgi:hypothetical protein
MSMLELILIAALLGFGFRLMMDHTEEMLFGWYNLLLIKLRNRSIFGAYIAKPLGLCIICNTTWIGIMLAWYKAKPIIEMIIIGGAAAGLVTLISVTYKKILLSLEDE